ncbi:MAG TPA: hypothetical protein PKC43_10180 [Phycisphaerales bacterium]|mgnify:CR=1 FL=1|nr:hypothetical protein [Phycisphaerales bacterium]HMP37803.1 hypothetical protein [Phycisphaerales bacterium]
MNNITTGSSQIDSCDPNVRGGLGSSVLGAVIASASALAIGAVAVADVPSIEAIRDAILAQRALLSTFEVSAVTERVVGPGHAVGRTEEWYSGDGDRFAYRVRHGTVPSEPASGLLRWSIYDGQDGLQYWGATGNAKIMAGPTEFADFVNLEASDFFASMAWFPIAELTTGGQNQRDLTAILSRPSVSVRPTTEHVGEFECVVVDAVGPDSPSTSLWLAVDHGFVPIRQIHFRGAEAILVREVQSVTTLENGAVVPTAGRRIVMPRGGDPDLAGGLEYEFHVALGDTGAPMASVAPLPASRFDLDENLPPGTLVSSADLSETYVVAGRPLAESADRVLAARFGDVRPVLSGHLSERPRPGALLIATIVAGVIGVTMGVAWRRLGPGARREAAIQ